jgi:Transglycosylase SLT domain
MLPNLLQIDRHLGVILGLYWVAGTNAFAHGPARVPTLPVSTLAADHCLMPAAQRHGVNPSILVSRNRNGSLDVGMAQINSIHFRELAQWGITPERLLDPCVATHVAAWHLKRVMLHHGNTWFGVAAYHSATPVHNLRYQALLRQELVRTGVWR